MQELALTATIWGLALGARHLHGMPRALRNMSRGLGREHLAALLLLWATHARTERLGAAEALDNPFTLETLARAGIVLLAFAVVVRLFVTRVRFAQAVRERWWGLLGLGIYAAAAVISVLYSNAPMVTAGKALEIGVAFGLAWSLLARPDRVDALKKTVQVVLYAEAALIAIAVVGFFILPSVFSENLSRTGFLFRGTLVSPYQGPNGFSAVGAMLAAFGLAQFFSAGRRKGAAGWLWLVLLGTMSIMLGSGRQGVAIWMVSLGVLVLVYRKELFLLVVAPTGVGMAAVYGDTIVDVLRRGQVEGSLNTLTGRTVFWSAGWEAFTDQPITGFGFGAGGRYEALRRVGLDNFSHLHNGYLESLVGVGLMGFVPFVIAILRMAWWAIGSLARKVDTPYAVLVIPLLLQNAVGMGFGAWLNTHLLLFGLIVALADARGVGRRRRAIERTAKTLAVR